MFDEIKGYDEKGNHIYSKYFFGRIKWWKEYWYKYDKNNKQVEITEKEFKEIEFRAKEKEYLSRKKVSRFELMDI